MSGMDDDLTRIVRSWIRMPETPSTDRLVADALLTVALTQQRGERRFAGRLLMSPLLQFAAAATAITIVAVIVGGALSRSGPPAGGPASASGSPSATASPSPTPQANDTSIIRGLPSEGVPPTSESGDLVLRLESGLHQNTMWVYADGRVIKTAASLRLGDGYVGLAQQQLTPAGAEYLRTQVLATGLFDADFAFLRDGSFTPFLEIDVSNGQEMVRGVWAWSGALPSGSATPVATVDQATALTDLEALLTRPSLWPADGWDDESLTAYVPAQYDICVRVLGARASNQTLLDALPVEPRRLMSDALLDPAFDGCLHLSTADARELSRALTTAGIQRNSPPAFWLRHAFPNPVDPTGDVWFSFMPVLPNGEAAWFGPG